LLNYIIIVSPHRSGGNLLIRLLDTHPKIFVNHTEQLFGIFINKEENSKFEQKLFKNKSLKNKSIKNIFDELLKNDEKHLIASKNGWSKNEDDKKLLYPYDPKIHYHYFQDLLKKRLHKTYKDCLDTYVYALNQSLNKKNFLKKRYLLNYWPCFAKYSTNMKNFKKMYPHARFIYILRDPISWSNTCKIRRPNNFSLEYIKKNYNQSILNFLKLKSNIDILIDFEDLILKPKVVIKNLLKEIDLQHAYPRMNIPTFRNMKIKSNSIKKKHRTYKINTGPINLNNLVVTQNELKQIKKFFFKNYLKLLNLKIKLIKFNDHL